MNTQKNIEQLETKLNELQSELKKLKEETKREQPTNNDIYFFCTSNGMIAEEIWGGLHVDIERYTMGSYFRTKEECEEAIELLKVLATIKKYASKMTADAPGDRFCICYNCLANEVQIHPTTTLLRIGITFDSRELAQNCIDEIGKDRLNKYWFNIT